jgi:hypothetical protein
MKKVFIFEKYLAGPSSNGNAPELEKLLNNGWNIINSIPTSGTDCGTTCALIILEKKESGE